MITIYIQIHNVFISKVQHENGNNIFYINSIIENAI